MNATYIGILNKRLDELNSDDFDLDVWKNGTSLLLSRIFGENSAYIKAVDELKIDFSSWTLRDATSEYNPKESAKRQGREILELAVAELQSLATQETNLLDLSNVIGDKADELVQVVTKKDEASLRKLLKKESKENLADLLIRVLLQ